MQLQQRRRKQGQATSHIPSPQVDYSCNVSLCTRVPCAVAFQEGRLGTPNHRSATGITRHTRLGLGRRQSGMPPLRARQSACSVRKMRAAWLSEARTPARSRKSQCIALRSTPLRATKLLPAVTQTTRPSKIPLRELLPSSKRQTKHPNERRRVWGVRYESCRM
jgi:hypothetical protein